MIRRKLAQRWWGRNLQPGETWNMLGEKVRHDRIRREQSSDPDPQTYDYDRNGNRTQDERGEHAFNARDQLVRWTRPDDRGRQDRRGWSTEYTLNGTGAMLRKLEKDAGGAEKIDTSFELDGERLETSNTVDRTQEVPVETKQTFRYDDAGNVQRIYTRVQAEGAVVTDPEPDKTALRPEECEADDLTVTARTTRYCYDEFNRQVYASGGATESSYVTYDGLDRRDRKARKAPDGGELSTEDFTYIGTSELLAEHASRSGTSGDLTAKRSSFDYDSQGDRQGQQIQDDAGRRYRPYAKDANGSVVGLENADGEIAASERYDYDPYGELDRKPVDEDATSEAAQLGLSEDAAENPFRFEGFFYDSGVKTYDMHARAYRPDVGRFLQRDQFASAAGDQALQADPLTQNRYAFAGANPVNNIEFDGHYSGNEGAAQRAMKGSSTPRGQRRVTARERAIPGRTDSTGFIHGRAPTTPQEQVQQTVFDNKAPPPPPTVRATAVHAPGVNGAAGARCPFGGCIQRVDDRGNRIKTSLSESQEAAYLGLAAMILPPLRLAQASGGVSAAAKSVFRRLVRRGRPGGNSAAKDVPNRVARVVEERVGRRAGTLGPPGQPDAYVTNADDIAGMSAKQIAERLSLHDDAGKLRSGPFSVFEFDAPIGIASPIRRTNPGFVGGGRTAGGASEYVVPNSPLASLGNLRRRTVR